MSSPLPERFQHPAASDGQLAPHHRPPNIVYTQDGRPMHFTIGQPPPPQHIVVQAPQTQGLPPELQRLIIITFLILAVVVVCGGMVIGIIVIAGGTLMGIIGTVSANLPFIGVTLVGAIVAVGWAASRIKAIKEK